MRVFYAIYVPDPELRSVFDTIRLFYSPTTTHSAHITVRGPYSRRVDVRAADRAIAGQSIVLHDVGHFFRNGQHTVYFEAYADRMFEVWEKPDFPFAPHLTLYDGRSRARAVELYQLLTRFPLTVPFKASGLNELISQKAQTSITVIAGIDFDFVSRIARMRLDPTTILELPEQYKRAAVDRFCRYLSDRSDETLRGLLPTRSDTALGLSSGWSVDKRPRLGRGVTGKPDRVEEIRPAGRMRDVLDTLWSASR